MPTSTSGATTARSSSMSTSSTIASTSGMTTSRSRCAVSCTSMFVAVKPPTRASAPGTACTVRRRSPITARACGDSGAASSVARIRTRPPTTFGGGGDCPAFLRSYASSGSRYGSTFATPGTPDTADTTASSLPAEATMTAGVPSPAGKCWPSRSCAALDCTGARNDRVRGTPPASSWVSPNARPTSARAVTTQTSRGRRPTAWAIRDHTPRSATAGEPTAGRNGQNAHRPSSTRIAGSSTSIDTSAQAMPTAATGPSPRVDDRFDASRHSSPRMTVLPLAATGGTDARQATRMARYAFLVRRSSSR